MHAQSYILFIYSSALPGTKIHPWSNKINSVWSFDRMNDRTVSFVLMAVEAPVETICAWARVRACHCVCGRTLTCVSVSVWCVCVSLHLWEFPSPCFSLQPASPAVRVRLNQSEPPGFVFPIANDTVGQQRGHRFTSHPLRGHVSWLLWGMSGPTWRVRVVFWSFFVTVARWSVWKKPKHLEKAAVSTALQRNNVIL